MTGFHWRQGRCSFAGTLFGASGEPRSHLHPEPTFGSTFITCYRRFTVSRGATQMTRKHSEQGCSFMRRPLVTALLGLHASSLRPVFRQLAQGQHTEGEARTGFPPEKLIYMERPSGWERDAWLRQGNT